MKISHPSFRTIVLAGLLLVLPSTMVVVLAQESCPPIIASLFPKDVSIRSGQYFPGDYGSGRGSADLPFSFENPSCVRTEYSARIDVEVNYYGGELAALIKSNESPYGSIDRDADKEQFITDATHELARANMTPEREPLGIGEIVYVEYKSECPPTGQATAAARIGPIIVPTSSSRAWPGRTTPNCRS